ncbi:MAG: hypothetical protein KGZ94_12370 [Clostridia bacterium]|nr:hypothetical protein [Clostridia bacterium]
MVANQVRYASQIEKVINAARENQFISGIIIIMQGEIGIWGDLELSSIG